MRDLRRLPERTLEGQRHGLFSRYDLGLKVDCWELLGFDLIDAEQATSSRAVRPMLYTGVMQAHLVYISTTEFDKLADIFRQILHVYSNNRADAIRDQPADQDGPNTPPT